MKSSARNNESLLSRVCDALGMEAGYKKDNLQLSGAFGRHQLQLVLTDGGGVDNLSGLLTTGEMEEFLKGILAGVELVELRRRKVKEVVELCEE